MSREFMRRVPPGEYKLFALREIVQGRLRQAAKDRDWLS